MSIFLSSLIMETNPYNTEGRFKKSAKAGIISITWMRDENQNPLCGHAPYSQDGNNFQWFILHQIEWEKILLNVIESEEPIGY